MPFTDDDLKRAKEELSKARRCEWPFPDAEALLFRLEAAEKVAEAVEHGSAAVVIDALLKKWRKAAGK